MEKPAGILRTRGISKRAKRVMAMKMVKVKLKRRPAIFLNSYSDLSLARTSSGTPMESKTSTNIRNMPIKESAIKKASV